MNIFSPAFYFSKNGQHTIKCNDKNNNNISDIQYFWKHNLLYFFFLITVCILYCLRGEIIDITTVHF